KSLQMNRSRNYLERVTPTRSQYFNRLHCEHLGEIGRQRFCPNVTSRSFSSIQYFCGSFSRRANSVLSGVFVCTYPQRLQMRWTCVSTQIPGFRCPSVMTRFAVFRPTPLKVSNSSILQGTF